MSTKYFFIAGEPSGDVLGASLIQGLKESGVDFEMTGIGGEYMGREGLQTLVAMDEFCVIGLWEVLSQIMRLRRLVLAMVEEIEKRKPDVLVTIDLPDFNFRVAKMLKIRGIFKGKIVHYVAPTVWAWRPGRAKKIAGFLDGLMCLYPFEPEYFKKHGLKAAFVGHPIADNDQEAISGSDFLEQYGIKQETKRLGVFLGSRKHELKSIAPVILDAVDAINEQQDDMIAIMPTTSNHELALTNIANELPVKAFVVTNPDTKWPAFKACDFAIAVSGTVALELAYMGVPHMIVYKVHPVSWILLKILVKVKFAHLGSILLERQIVPELLQFQCTSFKIAETAIDLMNDPAKLDEQRSAFKELAAKLKAPGRLKSSAAAARYVTKFTPAYRAQLKAEKAAASAVSGQ